MDSQKAVKISWIQDLIGLALILGVLFFILLGARFLQVPDEGRYVEIPREMLALHDFVTPHINFIKYFEKPPLFYWIEAAEIKCFGLGFWSVRAPIALLAIFGGLFTYVAARVVYGRAAAVLATLILASSPLYFVMAHTITLDMPLSTWLTGALFSFLIAQNKTGRPRDYWLWAMYVFSALAVMTKGLVGVIFPGMIVFAWMMIFQNWRELRAYRLISGAVIVLLINAPWHILAQIRNPEFFHFYVIDQQFLRYFTPYAGREQPLWFLPFVLGIGFLPWIFFLIQSFFSLIRESLDKAPGSKNHVFLMLWVVLIYAFFQVSHSQLMPYLLPIFAPMSLIVSRYFCSLAEKKSSLGMRLGLAVFALFGLGVLIAYGLIYSGVFGPIEQKIEGIHRLYFTITIVLLALVAFLSAWAYRFKSLSHAALVLALGMGCVLISVLLNREVFEVNSTYSLVKFFEKNKQPGEFKMYSYENYFQDLPVYLRHSVVVVGDKGNLSELTFGAQHQSLDGLFVSYPAFWGQNCEASKPEVQSFVMMPMKVYAGLNPSEKNCFLIEKKTSRAVLLKVKE